FTGFGGEERFVDGLLERFEPRIADAKAFALENRVLLLKASSGVGLDIALAGLPFEESLVGRSSLFQFPGGIDLRTCSSDDLIILKAFAARQANPTRQNSQERTRSTKCRKCVLDCHHMGSHTAAMR